MEFFCLFVFWWQISLHKSWSIH